MDVFSFMLPTYYHTSCSGSRSCLRWSDPARGRGYFESALLGLSKKANRQNRAIEAMASHHGWKTTGKRMKKATNITHRHVGTSVIYSLFRVKPTTYPLIWLRIALASAAGSAAAVMGRPTTIWVAPAAIASAGVTTRT